VVPTDALRCRVRGIGARKLCQADVCVLVGRPPLVPVAGVLSARVGCLCWCHRCRSSLPECISSIVTCLQQWVSAGLSWMSEIGALLMPQRRQRANGWSWCKGGALEA